MIEPESLFDVGATLFHGDADEAHRRSAISRFYYGCHLIAAEAMGLGGQDFGGGTHREVINQLARSGQQKLASDLEELCKWRNKCDYRLKQDVPMQKARKLRKKAEAARIELLKI